MIIGSLSIGQELDYIVIGSLSRGKELDYIIIGSLSIGKALEHRSLGHGLGVRQLLEHTITGSWSRVRNWTTDHWVMV